MKKRYLYIILLFLVSAPVWSQDRQGEVKDAEFIIEKKKAIRLPVTNRIFLPFSINSERERIMLDLTIEEPRTEVPMFSPKIRDTYQMERKETEFLPHYVRGGFGNLVSPLVEYSFREVGDSGYGAHLFHESFGRGPVRDENSGFSESSLNLWGKMEGQGASLGATIDYQRNGFYFYGISDSLFNSDEADSLFYLDRAARNDLQVGFEIKGGSGSDFRYSVIPRWIYTNLVDFSAYSKENFVDIETSVSYDLSSEFSFSIGLDGALANSKSDSNQLRTWINVNPSVLIKKEYLLIKLGMVLNNQTDDLFGNNVLIAPDLSATYRLSRASHAFIKVNGGVVKNTLNEITKNNFWLSDSVQLTSSLNKIHVLAGWNGYLTDNLRTEAKVSYQLTDNQALLLNAEDDPSRFNVVYDSGFSIISTGVSADYQMSNGLKILTNHKVNIYNTSSQDEAWHLPVYKGETGVSKQFGQFEAETTILMLSGIKSYSSENQEVIKLSSIFDFGIDISYSINPKGKVFLSLKNILNQDNERFLNYPSIPFSFKIGGSYNF